LLQYPTAPLSGCRSNWPLGEATALTVKIENTPEALPNGIDQPTLSTKKIVNGGITRLAAIFNSHAPAKLDQCVRCVPPILSRVAWADLCLSGGAPYAVASISTVPGLKLIDESSAGTAMFATPTLRASQPFRDRAQLFAFGAPGAPALFSYRTPKEIAVVGQS